MDDCCLPAELEEGFSVAINPEARVSAAWEKPCHDPGWSADAWTRVPVTIYNEGVVTGTLEATVESEAPVALRGNRVELTGDPVQRAELEVRFEHPGIAFVAMRFVALGAIGGLADRNTARTVWRCA